MIRAGADIGGTSLRLRLERNGAPPRVLRRTWGEGDRSPERLVLHLREMLAEGGVADDGSTGTPPLALGVAIAGQVDRSGAVVRNAPNLGWKNVPLREHLSSGLAPQVQRVVLLNDLHAAALAESRSGAAAGTETALVVFVGTGIGGALVLRGEVHHGASGAAGEIGHVKVQGQDGCCGCGERGCVEALAGGLALERAVREILPSARMERHPLACWQDAVDGRHRQALDLIEDRAEILGRVVAGAATLCSPDVLVLGGGVLQAVPSFREALVAAIRRDVLAVTGEVMCIKSAQHGDAAGAIGALEATRAAGNAMAT